MKAIEAKNAIYKLAADLEELPDSIEDHSAGWSGDLQDLDSALDTLQDVIDAIRSEIEHALNA